MPRTERTGFSGEKPQIFMKANKDIQLVLKLHPEHKFVYFDTLGNHYFNAFPQLGETLVTWAEVKDKKEGIDYQLYGTGEFHSRRVIPGIHNVEKRTEVVSKGKKITLIVGKISREEVLAENFDEEDLTIVQRLAKATPEELAQIRSLLLPSNVMPQEAPASDL